MKSESVGLQMIEHQREDAGRRRRGSEVGRHRGFIVASVHVGAARGLIEEESIDLMAGIIACCCVDSVRV